MADTPVRIQRRRAKGWKMPPDAVVVDRSTKWGNPFIVGEDGTAAECVWLYLWLVTGHLVLTATKECLARQEAAHVFLQEAHKQGWPTLRGRSLACWCHVGRPCHVDVLLHAANKPGVPFDVDGYFREYGYAVIDGRLTRLLQ